MRIIITILTDNKTTEFAIDFYLGWPFFAFEWLDDCEDLDERFN